jgi:opacity protein-like surface antigen
MKKLLLICGFVCCVAGSALAQTEKGSTLIGGTGTVHIDTEGTEEDKGYFLILSPRVGFFVANNFAIGTALPGTVAGNRDYASTTIGLTPFLRGYVGSSATRFLLEVRGGYTYSILKYEGDLGDFKESQGFTSYGVGAGFAHFINEHVGLEFLLSYDQTNREAPVIEYTHLSGINLNIGLQVYLPSRK